MSISREMKPLIEKSIETGNLTREELVFLISRTEEDDFQAIINAGDEVRKRCVGSDVHIRGLIEFSNFCVKSCKYCGLRSPNAAIERYRIPPEEIVEIAQDLNRRGIKTAVLQSGEDPWYTQEIMCDIIRKIKSTTDMAVTLCIGERPFEDYQAFKDAGADRYLLRHETANPRLYKELHPDSDQNERLACLRELKRIGFQTGAGFMVGLPGQTYEDIADDILLLKEYDVDMAGIGPFIPHPDTPLSECPQGDLNLSLKAVALTRIVLRDALLPATTAMGSIDEFGREKALQAGANVVMPNYTPLKYRTFYEIYPNKRCINEDPGICDGCMRGRILSIGRTISTDRGDSPKKLRAKTSI